MKIRGRVILILPILAVLLGLAYWNQAFILTYLIEPIARIFWLIWRTFQAVDQEIYWALLIVAAVILILRMIPETRDHSIRSAYSHSIREMDRVAYWESLLKSAEESKYDWLALQHEIEDLRRSIAGPNEETVEENICLPPFKNGFRQRVRSLWVVRFLSTIIPQHPFKQATQFEKQMDSILKSMETQLEIRRDGKSNQNHDN